MLIDVAVYFSLFACVFVFLGFFLLVLVLFFAPTFKINPPPPPPPPPFLTIRHNRLVENNRDLAFHLYIMFMKRTRNIIYMSEGGFPFYFS